jgi:hypothetical protein
MSQKWFNTGADWNRCPEKEVNSGNVMSIKFGNQFEPTYIRFFMAWKCESYKKFHVFAHLIEYDEQIKWNEIELEEYYQRYAN